MTKSKDPLDAGLPGRMDSELRGMPSVLTFLQERYGDAPRISLLEEESELQASPVIDPDSVERRSMPQGKGNYQLMGEIARGGMGIVVKGHDTDLGREVALKILNRDYADRPDVLRRFVEEAQIGGQLQHPGTVPVYELGMLADKRPYFAMRLIKGRTLAMLLAERESPESSRRKMLDVFEAVCQTVAYAHSRGVIHRDLKPANIMVGAFGEVQVVDWGLAKVLARKESPADYPAATDSVQTFPLAATNSSDSLVGSVMGTPPYMPPEQARGDIDRLDERSDVFSLGAILCEILTGAPPYSTVIAEALEEAARADLEGAKERLAQCGEHADLLELTLQCLAPDPTARPRNAGVVAERIQRYLESIARQAHEMQIAAAEAQVRAEEALVHAREERKRRELTVALGAAVLGMVLLGGGGWIWAQNERAAREREAAEREITLAQREHELLQSLSETLNEASLLRGRERWGEALVAIDGAQALAEAGDASEVLHARIAQVRGEVQTALDDAERRAEQLRSADELMNELEAVGQSEVVAQSDASLAGLFDWSATDRAYLETFSRYGIDVDGSAPGEVAAALIERGVGDRVVHVLHSWLVVRREQSRKEADRRGTPEKRGGAQRVVEVADLLDDDVLRSDLRAAMLTDDRESLELVAQSDLSAEPPATLGLLGVGLGLVGRKDAAARTLRDGIRRYPADYRLRVAFIRLLDDDSLWYRWNEASVAEELRHLQAAMALVPRNPLPRRIHSRLLLDLAWAVEERGDPEAGRAAFEEAVSEYEALRELSGGMGAIDYVWFGHALAGASRQEESAASYHRALRLRDEQPWNHGIDAWINEQVGAAFLAHGRFEAAEECYARILAHAPRNSGAHTTASYAYVMQLVLEGDEVGAVDALLESLERYPGARAVGMNDMAWHLARFRRSDVLVKWRPASTAEEERVNRAMDALLDEALRSAEKVVELDPQDIHYNTLAVVSYRVGDPGACIEALDRALDLSGEGTVTDWYFYAMAHHRLGHEEQALAYLNLAGRARTAERAPTRLMGREFRLFDAEATELIVGP